MLKTANTKMTAQTIIYTPNQSHTTASTPSSSPPPPLMQPTVNIIMACRVVAALSWHCSIFIFGFIFGCCGIGYCSVALFLLAVRPGCCFCSLFFGVCSLWGTIIGKLSLSLAVTLAVACIICGLQREDAVAGGPRHEVMIHCFHSRIGVHGCCCCHWRLHCQHLHCHQHHCLAVCCFLQQHCMDAGFQHIKVNALWWWCDGQGRQR